MVKNIIIPVCDVYQKPNDKSILETQFLFGEKIKVLEKNKNWALGKSEEDGYKGWLRNKFIGNYQEPNYKIQDLVALVYLKPDLKSKKLFYLPFNSKVLKTDETNDWARILINKNSGYVFKKHLVNINYNNTNIIKNIKSFLNIPYLLGGKSFMGIDCSGLIQVCLNFNGIKIPRNTIDQVKYIKHNIVDTKVLDKNCLIFWDGHVAISKSKNIIIHSNAYHMKVKKEALSIATKRLNSNGLSIKKIKQLNLK